MSLSMNNSNYMSNRNHFKDLALFYQKKMLMASHMIRNALDDLKNSEMFCTYFIEFFGPNQNKNFL